MAPAIFKTLLGGALATRGNDDTAASGPLAAHAALLARDTSTSSSTYVQGSGAISPTSINNNALFALFGIIGAAFVVTGIWFFFWAKNGGFHFRKNDWDDYKSTVLRRKGPNGTILSGATPTTILGGGSVYKDIDDGTTTTGTELDRDNMTMLSGTTGLTGITAGASDIAGREARRKKREKKERERERRREEKARDKAEKRAGREKSSRKMGPDGALIDEVAEQEAKEKLRQYRHEKPARVGGINKQSEGSSWDGSTNPSHSAYTGSRAGGGGDGMTEVDLGSAVTSELISYREKTPTSTPTKREKTPTNGSSNVGSTAYTATTTTTSSPSPRKERSAAASGGIRKVYSMADKTADREAERIRAEARKLAERGRAAQASQRRNFSFQRAEPTEHSAMLRIDEGESGVGSSSRDDDGHSRVPGSWMDSQVGTESDVGTKVYQHSTHIPVPSAASSDLGYQEEKRKKRGGAGYRRDRERG